MRKGGSVGNRMFTGLLFPKVNDCLGLQLCCWETGWETLRVYVCSISSLSRNKSLLALSIAKQNQTGKKTQIMYLNERLLIFFTYPYHLYYLESSKKGSLSVL